MKTKTEKGEDQIEKKKQHGALEEKKAGRAGMQHQGGLTGYRLSEKARATRTPCGPTVRRSDSKYKEAPKRRLGGEENPSIYKYFLPPFLHFIFRREKFEFSRLFRLVSTGTNFHVDRKAQGGEWRKNWTEKIRRRGTGAGKEAVTMGGTHTHSHLHGWRGGK